MQQKQQIAKCLGMFYFLNGEEIPHKWRRQLAEMFIIMCLFSYDTTVDDLLYKHGLLKKIEKRKNDPLWKDIFELLATFTEKEINPISVCKNYIWFHYCCSTDMQKTCPVAKMFHFRELPNFKIIKIYRKQGPDIFYDIKLNSHYKILKNVTSKNLLNFSSIESLFLDFFGFVPVKPQSPKWREIVRFLIDTVTEVIPMPKDQYEQREYGRIEKVLRQLATRVEAEYTLKQWKRDLPVYHPEKAVFCFPTDSIINEIKARKIAFPNEKIFQILQEFHHWKLEDIIIEGKKVKAWVAPFGLDVFKEETNV
ncbi:MAG: hypothetical protein LWW95_08100 [Candidatus Desulfofervidus auxilii]|nr:hypothetical protein [Candidatus Desulfofervidus auxilii]